MKRNNLKGSLILIVGSFIWGLAFVVQSDAADIIPPFAFNGIRSFLGALSIFVFLLVKNKPKGVPVMGENKVSRKTLVSGSVICGIFLAFSINFQQYGIAAYPDGVAAEARAGFLTALYVVLVPIASLFIKKVPSFTIWIAVAVAIVGIYFLCLKDGFYGIMLGDLLMFFCAVSCTLHIIIVDRFGPQIGGAQLSMLQFIVCGAVSCIASLIFEKGGLDISNIIAAGPQLLYMGILSSGVAYTLQIVGQRYAEPAVASLSMSLESVFATLGGWIIMGNALSKREFLGCVMVFAAIIIAQIPELITQPKSINKEA